jgi:perosamine synthetase
MNKKKYLENSEIIKFCRSIFASESFIPLHEPRFLGNEKKYLNQCIDSTFVSSVGEFVDTFEQKFAKKVGSKFAIATVNGTSALHISLILAGVKTNDEVITQPLSFVAPCNAIKYVGANPVFLDVDIDTLGLSPFSLKVFFENNCSIENNECINKKSRRKIAACLPVHIFGHPCRIDEIRDICNEWNVELIEDAAESLGSHYKGKHTGTYGKLGAFSFNGNKIITSGGGGVIVTDDKDLAKKARHLSTTAKKNHPYEYVHDEIGFNYRMPNLNAALLLAQLEQLDIFLESKKKLANLYHDFFHNSNVEFIMEPKYADSNYWLQAILFKDKVQRDLFLESTNNHGIMTRPIWKLINELEMFKDCQSYNLVNAKFLESRVVNIPSSSRIYK